ncbi:MAG: DUF1836 domain-containing protein [Lachnospiraceae bacterium]|nr:DUF1836 domain-containing protein [Lachnospiraceae bacterium]
MGGKESLNKRMNYDKELIAGKLRRWEKFILNYRLPDWDIIPDIGLYMEQVISLLEEYIDYLPPDLKTEQFVTPAAINNYVRKKIMPEPVKKKYYRIHIVYLIMICMLKQSLSISLINTILPAGISEEEVRSIYTSYAEQHHLAATGFRETVRLAAGKILDHEDAPAWAPQTIPDFIILSATFGGLASLMTEKLLLLDGKTMEDTPINP